MTTTLASRSDSLSLNAAIDCLAHIDANPKTPELRMVAAQIIESVEQNNPNIAGWIDNYYTTEQPRIPYVQMIRMACAALGAP